MTEVDSHCLLDMAGFLEWSLSSAICRYVIQPICRYEMRLPCVIRLMCFNEIHFHIAIFFLVSASSLCKASWP